MARLAPALRNLHELHTITLYDNWIGHEGLVQLAAEVLPSLPKLMRVVVQQQAMDASDARLIIRALERHEKLKSIDLLHGNLGLQVVSATFPLYMHNPNLSPSFSANWLAVYVWRPLYPWFVSGVHSANRNTPSPAARFFALDGDHAIALRVLAWLAEEPFRFFV